MITSVLEIPFNSNKTLSTLFKSLKTLKPSLTILINSSGMRCTEPYYAGGGQAIRSNQSSGYGKVLRHPTVQSRSQVEVRIRLDRNTDMNIDTSDLLGWF